MPIRDERNHWKKLEPILDRALDLEGDARSAYLSEACGGDDALRTEIGSLLASTEGSGPLDRSLDELVPSVAQKAGDALQAAEPAVGRLLGAWRILEPLGLGGMGRVFRAERADSGFQQQCALKLLRWEMATPSLIERFQQERQILARLEHPGIARLIDGGVLEDGLPYLAVELVEGSIITEYATEHELDVEQRLDLFLQVVDAVDYAHRNLVVHRDLKPSNILVAQDGRVRLLDFGIAKILDEAEGQGTRTRHAMATPRSAAPEQLSGGHITTAADVWALGVLLYELLAERAPFAAEGDTATAITHKVLHEDPRPPSEGLADARRRRLRGDLDTIVLTALRKEPARRYASAERLGEDVRRHLKGHPVLARPATWSYRARKFVRRHRSAVTLVAALLALVVGLSAFYTVRLASERARVLRQARKTEEVKAFLLSLFQVDDPSVASGLEITARELLDRGSARIGEELTGEPEIQAELVHVIAGLFEELGLYEQATVHFEQAVQLRRENLTSGHPDLAESLNRWGFVLQEVDRLEEAETALREAMQVWERNPDDPTGRSATLNQLGMVLAYQGQYDEAEALLRECVAVKREVLGDEGPSLAASLSNLGLTVKWKGDFDAAEPLYREALAIRREALGDLHPDVAVTLDNLGVLLGQRGDYEESERCFREALDIRKKTLGEDHPDVALALNNLATLFRVQGRIEEAQPIYEQVLEMNIRQLGPGHRRVATNLTNLASISLQRGHYELAEERFRRALEIRREKLGDEHPEVAETLDHLVMVLVRQERFSEAEPQSREAVAVVNEAVEADSPMRATILCHRGEVLLGLDRPGEAAPFLEEALAIQEAALAEDHWRTAATRAALGRTHVAQGDLESAEPMLRNAYDVLRTVRGADDPDTERTRQALANLYRGTGKPDQAEDLERSARGEK